ncbi:Hypothetical protein DEACI_1554 [Acididesulfobacillus acetoxydans]|uniref:Uncharacterized protein n=1 Tax=Acididesulfobacillus acetoxydans TaxID=1561005 RepID=A0A8S0WXD9_9FIRM|nr:Hypothetical protein DEACI_1554 [Acididesulfobacillus acetoxydans]CEJ08942.1 Hypothetical protein DEACI_3424 [Acididesulfobacillus acetoxydans]
MEQLAPAGVVKLPAKQSRQTYRAARLRAEPLPEAEIVASLRELWPLTVEPVPPQEAAMVTHHAVDYQRAFGAHKRCWANRPQGHAGSAKPDCDRTGTGAPQGRWP